MTTAQIFACAIVWTVAIAAITAYVTARVTRCRAATRWCCFRCPVERGAGYRYLRTQKTEYEALKEKWQREHGNDRTAHRVKELRPVSPVACPAYQPSTEPADSGLCARCGMFDYKHREPA